MGLGDYTSPADSIQGAFSSAPGLVQGVQNYNQQQAQFQQQQQRAQYDFSQAYVSPGYRDAMTKVYQAVQDGTMEPDAAAQYLHSLKTGGAPGLGSPGQPSNSPPPTPGPMAGGYQQAPGQSFGMQYQPGGAGVVVPQGGDQGPSQQGPQQAPPQQMPPRMPPAQQGLGMPDQVAQNVGNIGQNFANAASQPQGPRGLAAEAAFNGPSGGPVQGPQNAGRPPPGAAPAGGPSPAAGAPPAYLTQPSQPQAGQGLANAGADMPPPQAPPPAPPRQRIVLPTPKTQAEYGMMVQAQPTILAEQRNQIARMKAAGPDTRLEIAKMQDATRRERLTLDQAKAAVDGAWKTDSLDSVSRYRAEEVKLGYARIQAQQAELSQRLDELRASRGTDKGVQAYKALVSSVGEAEGNISKLDDSAAKLIGSGMDFGPEGQATLKAITQDKAEAKARLEGVKAALKALEPTPESVKQAPSSTSIITKRSGKIHVRLKDGQVGWLAPSEFDSATMEKIP